MNYTVKEVYDIVNSILNLRDWKIFTETDAESYDFNVDPEQYTLANGVSKFCIIPKDKDYVIKIPFTGMYDANGWSYNKELDEYEEQYLDFEGAGAESSSWDYCAAESEVYMDAKENHVEEFFAETIQVGQIGYYPIYIQSKCNIVEDIRVKHDYTSKEVDNIIAKISNQISRSNYLRIHDMGFVCDIIENYTLDKVIAFFQFLGSRGISDLRTSNIGYLVSTGKPVLTDYSGFDS